MIILSFWLASFFQNGFEVFLSKNQHEHIAEFSSTSIGILVVSGSLEEQGANTKQAKYIIAPTQPILCMWLNELQGISVQSMFSLLKIWVM